MNFNKLLNKYDYQISPALIAQKPASPRDSARLLIYDKKSGRTRFSTFAKIAEYLPKNSVLVFNQTKVVPARLTVKKETGGKAEILYIKTVGSFIEVIADRRLIIGSKISVAPKVNFIVANQKEKYYRLKPSFPVNRLFDVLERYGQVPLPPYIKHTPLSQADLKEKYQSVFAREKGSIAAPTASLHFTRRLIENIKKSGIEVRFVTLHVNLGTFAPLTESNIKTGRLHKEYYEIDKKTTDFLNKYKKRGAPIIGVGTTVVRALESASDRNGHLINLSGATDLFIKDGYKFKFVDGIVTNFHVPKSSLMMLCASFTGREEIIELYRQAAKKKFKFFSFGDGMLIY